MQTKKWIKWLLIATVTVMMSACGGGGPGATAQDIAIAKIVEYAESNGTTPAPTEDDYINAGVDLDGVDTNDINDYIATLDTTQVDSEEDIQQIADDAGVWLVDTDGDGKKDYADDDDDGDGVSDVEEETTGSDPLDVNSTAHHGVVYKVIKSPYTDRLWLDRNLGATQVCTAYNDTACYGDYYQWGRNADGHEKIDSNITGTRAGDVNNVEHGDFITDGYTWANVDRNGSIRSVNWSKTDGSFICPVGFRVPTIEEIEDELLNENSAEIQKGTSDKPENSNDRRENAFNSFLHLASAGSRGAKTGDMENLEAYGYLWPSSISRTSTETSTPEFRFYEYSASVYEGGHRPFGISIRCIKN